MSLRTAMAFALLLVAAGAGARCAHVSPVTSVNAQAQGQVRGRVFDEYSGSIPDASVLFQPVDPKSGLTEFRAVADSRGRFDFEGVRAGTYRVTCRADGYETTVAVHEVRPGVQTEVTLIMRAVK